MGHTVRRCLEDPSLDEVDHALGRPFDPLGDTSRDHIAAQPGSKSDLALAESTWWERAPGTPYGLHLYRVTGAGREALAAYLAKTSKHRLWVVRWRGYTWEVVATTLGKARFQGWTSVTDSYPSLAFVQFLTESKITPASRSAS